MFVANMLMKKIAITNIRLYKSWSTYALDCKVKMKTKAYFWLQNVYGQTARFWDSTISFRSEEKLSIIKIILVHKNTKTLYNFKCIYTFSVISRSMSHTCTHAKLV